MPRFQNITGKRFGRLVVLSQAEKVGKMNCWRCLCDCGTISVAQVGNLNSGHTKSCGCLGRSMLDVNRKFRHPENRPPVIPKPNIDTNLICATCSKELRPRTSRIGYPKMIAPRFCRSCARKTHGMTNSNIHRRWLGMMTRCGHFRNGNPNDKKNYIGRGITVCDEWHKFENFYEWATANGFRPDLTIDRIDDTKGYGPDNCQFLTMRDNVRRKTSLKLSVEKAMEIRRLYKLGIRKADLARKFDVNFATIYDVIERGAWMP